MSQQNQHLYKFDGFCLDAEKRTLLRNGELVPLAPKAFDTLLVLIQHQGQVLDKERLMEMLWPDSIVEEANLPQNISILRKALGESPNQRKYITTISGRGYKFAADVEQVSGATEAIFEKYSKATVIVEEQEEENQESLPDQTQKSLSATNLPLRRWRSSTSVMALLILAVGVSTALYFFLFHRTNESSPQTAIQSIAVLPFINASGNMDVEYLSDGMSDSLINSLSQLPNLSVKARSSVFRYKGREIEVQTIASELSVQAILSGRVVQRDDDLTLYLSLVDARTGNQLWGEQYNRKLKDLATLQSEIALDVSNKLRLKLSGTDEQKLAKNYTVNVEAYQLYLRGRFHVFKLMPPEIFKGILYFQQAIEIDPNYALAYAGISDAYRSLALSCEMLPTEVFPKAKAAAQKAIELDDTLSEAHTTLGMDIVWYDWDWSAAENQYKRALELNPNSSDAHLFYAHLLSNLGRHAEALIEIKRARELDPLSPFANALEGQFLNHAGRTDEALDRLQKTFELSSNFWMPHLFAASTYIEKGMYAEAIAEAHKATELSPAQTIAIAFSSYALAKLGRRDEARAALKELLQISTRRFMSPYHIALAYNGLSEKDETFAWLERGFEQRDPKMALLKVEPKWNNLRDDLRFKDLLRRMNFPL